MGVCRDGTSRAGIFRTGILAEEEEEEEEKERLYLRGGRGTGGMSCADGMSPVVL
jgi:hypothetical protein